MNQLIFAFMQKGMTYKRAKEEVFRMLKKKRLSKESEDDRNSSPLSSGNPAGGL